MITEICLSVATVVFVLLAIYIIVTLVSLRKTLINLNFLLMNLDDSLKILADETEPLLRNTNALVEDTLGKTEKLNPMFNCVGNLGECLQKRANKQEENKEDAKEVLTNLLELASLGIVLWQKIKKRS